MKPPQRKLGEPIPTRLILAANGVLEMVDGSDPAGYLRAVRRHWINQGRMATGAPINITILDLATMEDIEADAVLARCQSA